MAPQDSFIDDEEDTCPLCIEEFDIQDKNFRPCPCGYQICQFCFNNIKNNINGLCPACRRPYDEKTIQWKVVTQEEIAEFRSNIQKNQKKRAAEQRQKEVQKREAEKENRKNLVGVRVVQKNLVYVTGLTPTVREDELLKTLRQKEFFGQYGNIQKISISNRKSDGHNPSLGIYVTFEKKEDAARCIQAVNGSQNGDRTLRAQLGTTKYCSAWLRHEVCSNRQCMFLHELGDEEDSYTRQDLSSLNSISTQTQRPLTSAAAASSSRSASRQQGHPTPSQQYAQPMARSSSNNGSENGDGPALPATANWARNPQIRSRRGSHATSGAAPSPATSHSLPVTAEVPQEAVEETHHDETLNEADNEESTQSQHREEYRNDHHAAKDPTLTRLLRAMHDYVFYLPTGNSDYPPLFDLRGGEKRRAMRDEEESRSGVHAEETQEARDASEGEPDGSGSLALGGEPEEGETGRTGNDYSRSATQPPIQRGSTDGLFGSGLGANQTPSYIGSVAGSRTQTPLQQQGFMRGTTGFGDNHPPPGLPPAQASLFSGQGHNRQGSRFSFANDSNNQSQATTVKLTANPRLMAQQSSMMPSTFSAQQSVYQNYPTTMPGPPPGLKSTGTPPAALFGQTQGFGTGAPDLLSLMRGRNTGASGMQGHDAGKREYMFSSFPNQYPPSSTSSTPAPSAPAPGHNLLGQLYGNQPVPGSFQDFGPKQKKKGKKQRHANTSSGGGSALVDLADPSILQAQARMQQQQQQQQQSIAGVGQGPLGGQPQDDDFLTSMNEAQVDALVSDEHTKPGPSAGIFARYSRPTTPAIPPGLGPSILAHPSPAVSHASLQNSTIGRQTPPVLPVTPLKPPPGVPVPRKVANAAVAIPSVSDVKKTEKENVKNTIKAMAIETGLSGDIASQSAKGKGKALLLQEEDFPALNSPAPKSTTPVAPGKQSQAAVKSSTTASKKAAKQKDRLERVVEKAEKSIEEGEKKKASVDPPVEKPSAKVAEKPAPEQLQAQEQPQAQQKTDKAAVSTQPSEALPRAVTSANDKVEKRPVPGILNIAAATRSTQKALDTSTATDSTVKSVTDKESAFPALPTPSSASTFTPAIRAAPKTLRVVSATPTPKAENHSSAVPSSVRSVSINRSETPASEAISDSASVISAGVSLSRTSSPPPSRVGTAPVRSTTKSQQRKARKEAVKKDVGVIVATPKIEPEEIGPILGRKKKQKKEKVTASSSATPAVSRPETPVTEKKDPTPAPPKEVKETKDDSSTYRSVAYEAMSLTDDTPPVRGQVADVKGKAMDNDASSAGSGPQTQISPATVFRQLIEDNYYPEGVEALNFIKPVTSSNDKHRHDQGSVSQAARDLLDKNLVEPQARSVVQEEDQAILLEGRPVRKLVDGLRVMLTPYGDCVRNLTPDEEERYLELQERVAEEASSPAVFVASRHEPSPGFSLIKGRAVPNGPPGYFPQAPGAFPQDPVNKIQREEAIYYINQYVLPRLNLGTSGFPGPWKNALQDGKVNLNAATANFNSTIAPYIDTAAPELSYPVPSPGGSSVGLADALPGPQHNSHSQNLASMLVNSLGPWPEPAHGGSPGTKFTGPSTSGGPFGSVPLMSQEDAEQALAAARKETEKLEKQLNQKIKKNRQFLNIDNNAAKLGMLTTAH